MSSYNDNLSDFDKNRQISFRTNITYLDKKIVYDEDRCYKLLDGVITKPFDIETHLNVVMKSMDRIKDKIEKEK